MRWCFRTRALSWRIWNNSLLRRSDVGRGFGPAAGLPAGATLNLKDFFRPVFQHRFYFGGELIAQCTVDQPVIERQRQIALRADGDGVVDDDRHFLDRTYAQNRN